MKVASITVAIALVALSGCATNQYDAQLYSQSTPTLAIECPVSGCQFSKLEYLDPRDRAQHTNANDAYIQTIKTIGGVLTSVAPFWAITSIMAPSITNTNSEVSNNSEATTTTTTTDTSTITPLLGVE